MPNFTTRIMPLCGLSQVARDLYPADIDNVEAMQQHIQELWTLNSDVLPNPESFLVGTVIQVPDGNESKPTKSRRQDFTNGG